MVKTRDPSVIKRRITTFGRRVRKDTGLAIVGAFALVIALTWNEVINATVRDLLRYLDVTGNTSHFRVLAALITTIICVAGIIYFSKWSEAER